MRMALSDDNSRWSFSKIIQGLLNKTPCARGLQHRSRCNVGPVMRTPFAHGILGGKNSQAVSTAVRWDEMIGSFWQGQKSPADASRLTSPRCWNAKMLCNGSADSVPAANSPSRRNLRRGLSPNREALGLRARLHRCDGQ